MSLLSYPLCTRAYAGILWARRAELLLGARRTGMNCHSGGSRLLPWAEVGTGDGGDKEQTGEAFFRFLCISFGMVGEGGGLCGGKWYIPKSHVPDDASRLSSRKNLTRSITSSPLPFVARIHNSVSCASRDRCSESNGSYSGDIISSKFCNKAAFSSVSWEGRALQIHSRAAKRAW